MSEPTPKSVALCKALNFANAALLIVAGIIYYITKSSINLPAALSAAYVIAFGAILLCFETQVSFLRRLLYRNFSFMFSIVGRIFFFALAGTLAFGLGTLGYITAGCTLANLVYNAYVLCANPEYADSIRRQHAQWELESVGNYSASPAAASSSDMGKVRNATPFDASGSSGTTAASASEPANGDTVDIGNGWQKIWDAPSHKYYYYNTTTMTTSWEPPF